jgi:hypothetical protein
VLKKTNLAKLSTAYDVSKDIKERKQGVALRKLRY